MTHDITADRDTLLKQQSQTTHTFFLGAIEHMDASSGEGYAKRNPHLVAAFVAACASDWQTTNISIAAQRISTVLGDAR
jgi:hypothetical protein